MSHGDYFARLIEQGKAAIYPYNTKVDTGMEYQPERALPTQIAYPWQATLRTLFATIVAALMVAAVVWSLYKGVGIETNVEAIVSAIVLVATGITRVMAHPAVNDALAQFNLGTEPNGDME